MLGKSSSPSLAALGHGSSWVSLTKKRGFKGVLLQVLSCDSDTPELPHSDIPQNNSQIPPGLVAPGFNTLGFGSWHCPVHVLSATPGKDEERGKDGIKLHTPNNFSFYYENKTNAPGPGSVITSNIKDYFLTLFFNSVLFEASNLQ